MREGTSIKEVLLGVEVHEITNNFIANLRESHPDPHGVFSKLPTFTFNDKGNIVTAEWYHQFVGCIKEEKDVEYTYFNIHTNDQFLLEEISDQGFEDLFEKDLDINKIISKFAKQKGDDLRNFVFPNVNYLIVEIKYETTYDTFGGGYDCEGFINIVGYLDNKLQRQSFNDE